MLKLHPFSTSPLSELFTVHAQLRRPEKDVALIEFRIEGPLAQLKIPSPSAGGGTRRDELWKTTCLEAFFSADQNSQSAYLEMNCSPESDWNVYSFTGYRQGMKPAGQVTVQMNRHSLEPNAAEFEIYLRCLALADAHWASLTCILQFQDGSTSYWALKHPAAKADFHDKAAFIAPF